MATTDWALLIFHTFFFMEAPLVLSMPFKGAVVPVNIWQSNFLHYPVFIDLCHLGIPSKISDLLFTSVCQMRSVL